MTSDNASASAASSADRHSATTTVHAIVDPLCGWCHAVEPLVDAVAALSDHRVVLHGGGLLAGSARRRIDADWQGYVLPHDDRIAQLTGQPFGEAYRNGLLLDESVVLDSEPTIAALLAVRALEGDELAMMKAMQLAYYVDGRNISERSVLVEVAASIGHEATDFEATFEAVWGDATRAHIEASRALLARVGGRGFPTFVVENADGSFTNLPHSDYFGRPGDWQQYLRQRPGN